MDETHGQKTEPADPIEAAQMNTAAKADVGNQDQDRRDELQKGAVNAAHGLNPLVQQNDRGVKDRRAQAEQNTDKVFVALSHRADPRNENDAKGGKKETYDLLCAHFFPKEQGTDRRDEDGGEIIAQGCHRNGGIFVRLKQQDPVDAHRHARDQKQGKLLFDLTEGDLLPCDQKKQSDQQGGKHGAPKGKLARGNGNVADERTKGAEDRHGKGK